MANVILQPKCPHCGADLFIEQLGDEPKPSDRVICPSHGFMGGRDEMARQTLNQTKDKIGEHLADHPVKKMPRDSGF